MGSWDMGELSANFVGRDKEVEADFFSDFPCPLSKIQLSCSSFMTMTHKNVKGLLFLCR
jgi:hypothetical protein